MEDLKGYKDYRKELIAGRCHMEAAKGIARDIATIHGKTHIALIGRDGIDNMVKQFS